MKVESNRNPVDGTSPNPDVSVIIATYNYEAFLPQSLESIFKQTETAWECIIVDDASTDNTRTILESWSQKDNRFRFFVLPANRGPSAARNRGLLEGRTWSSLRVWALRKQGVPESQARATLDVLARRLNP